MSSINIQKIRSDFQFFTNTNIIYFDNACMTLKPRQVTDAMMEYYENFPACAGRSIHKLSSKVEERVHDSRRTLQKFIGAKRQEEILFTRNTTEGLNLVANSLDLKARDTVLVSDREHNSNLVPWQILSERKKINLKIVPSKPDETFDLENFKNLLDSSVKAVSFVYSSNLDGYSLPISEIAKIVKDNGSFMIVDGAQSTPHKEINVNKLGVDFYACSGHKMLGPTGTGILYGKTEHLETMQPFLTGGETVEYSTYKEHKFLKSPEKFEAGLQDYAGIIGIGAAAKYLKDVGLKNIQKHEIELNKLITDKLSNISGLKLLGPKDPEMRGGIFSFLIDGFSHHDIALLLDNNANIAIRSGQHCVHSWFSSRKIKGSVRASLYLYNTMEEAEKFCEEVVKIVGLKG